jgi:L-iditol 2-dehydrogenase
VTEPLACAINGQQLAGLRAGDDVVIIGAGPVGCMHAKLARSNGAARVFLTDLGRRHKLATAAGLVDPDAAIDAAEVDPIAEVMRLTHGRGADANRIHYRELRAVGAAGASPAQNAQALELIGTRQMTVADLPRRTGCPPRRNWDQGTLKPHHYIGMQIRVRRKHGDA